MKPPVTPKLSNVWSWLQSGTAWWDERKAWFSQEFRQTVNSLMANPSSEAMIAGPKLY
jgi:hypothetical protein